MGCQSGAGGQELGKRSGHRDGPEQSTDDRLAPRGTPLYETTYGNVAPRLGVAYQLTETPNWGAVLRAGFGIFYDLGQGWLGGASAFFPHSATKSLVLVTFPLSPANAAPPPLTSSPPVNTILVADPHLNLPRTYQWNIALEQSVGSSQSLSLTYIGAIGRDLLRVTNFFNVNPRFQVVELTENRRRRTTMLYE